jgi:uncharacterized delta-60 repeat protein
MPTQLEMTVAKRVESFFSTLCRVAMLERCARFVRAMLGTIFVASGALAAPVVDTTFGTGGIARVGTPAGVEDIALASMRQPDGKMLVAGRTEGRASHAFAVRFTNAGTLDSTFGQGGVVLLDSALVKGEVTQFGLRADGSLLLGGSDATGYYVVHLSASGAVDAGFGTNGVLRRPAETFAFVVQPEGKFILLSLVADPRPLRMTRWDPDGKPDAAFGERTVSAPDGYGLGSIDVDGQGGFVVAMQGSARSADGNTLYVSKGPLALLHVTADGLIAPGFGIGGIVLNTDLGIPFGSNLQLVRSPAGGWFLAVTAATTLEETGAPTLLRLTDNGALDAAFGTAGRLELPAAVPLGGGPLVALPNGGALVARTDRGNDSRIFRITPAGTVDPQYGQQGVAVVAVPGYQENAFVAGFADENGAVAFPATLARVVTCPIDCFERGRDAAVVVLTPNGQLATGYGSGGVAVWDRLESSSDQVDAIHTLPTGAVVAAGFSTGNGTGKIFLTRFSANGTLDLAFGSGGRAYFDAFARCYGPVQAAGLPDGSVVASVGAAVGVLCNVGAQDNVGVSFSGVPGVFSPNFATTDEGNATNALVARTDGRLVHATADAFFATRALVVDQALPDGKPDLQFGINGRVSLAIPQEGRARTVTLALLPDGALIVATVSSHGLVLFKLDARGAAVAGFGNNGIVFIADEYTASDAFGRVVGIAVLADTSLYVQYDASTQTGGSRIRALRLSAAGALRSSVDLPAGSSRATFAVLADDSVVIAGGSGGGATAQGTLRRMLANDTFDPAFGPGGVYAIPGVNGIVAMAVDNEGRLVVAGGDPTSSLLTRLLLASVVAPATVVEFHHAALDHYFVTANPQEAAAVDAGAAGPGWSRTGLTFRSGGATKVCRFYGNAAPNPATGTIFGPNSHFYTAIPAECAFLIAIFNAGEKSWHFESYDFAATPPLELRDFPDIGAACPPGAIPVYRAYNRGFERGEDSNHRLTNSLAAYQATVARGWAGEGVRMCAPQETAAQ